MRFRHQTRHLTAPFLPTFSRLRLLPVVACIFLFVAPAFATDITGTVTNRTTGKPSSGDTIGVVNMAQSMDEIARTTSNASGSFHVSVPDGGQILLHVTHHGADYFKTVSAGTTTADVDVYDSAAKIAGISGEALVLHIETDPTGKLLNMAEDFFLLNSSAPPRTEFGGNTFDFYLPKGAKVTQSLARPPDGLPTTGKIVPIDAATGHYAYTFPLRPGETRFQVQYTLPYNGNESFSLKLSIPTGDVAVMVPKTMQFVGSSQFQPISPPSEASSQSFDAHQPAFSQPIQFSVTGTGQLPQSQEEAQGESQDASQTANDQSEAPAPAPQPVAGGTRPGGGLGVPDDPNGTNDPWAKYKWWILGLLGLALAGGAGVMLKSGPAPAVAVASPPSNLDITAPAGAYAPTALPARSHIAPAGVTPLMQALRDELFQLETDRLAGKLTDAEYAEHKAAFDLVLRRALSRADSA